MNNILTYQHNILSPVLALHLSSIIGISALILVSLNIINILLISIILLVVVLIKLTG